MKRVLFFIAVLVSLVIIKNLTSSILALWQKKDLLIVAQKELEAEKRKSQALKQKLLYVQTKQYVEEQARDKLFMAKPGEEQMIIPKELLLEKKPAPKPSVIEPNWKQWIRLFFN